MAVNSYREDEFMENTDKKKIMRIFVLPVRDQRQWVPGGDPPPDGAAE